MINKKTLVIVSGILSSIFLALNWIGTFRLCGGQEYGQCMDSVYGLIINFFPIIPLFIFSLITYKMRDDVYRVWIRFSYAWIPLSMILIFFSPEYSGGFGIPLYSMTKGSVAFMSSLLFVLISLLIIAWKYIASLPKY